MDWHIITSSKGGVGKTLISLMLLTYYRGRANVLAIDLNGVNADLRRLVADSDANDVESVELDLKNIGVFYIQRFPKLGYTIGWPKNAFKHFDSKDFHQLLIKISTEGKQKIQQNLKIDISTIIIDTNHHFCNIFSQESVDYQNYFFKKEHENLFIWFIWVYRDINNLIEMNPDNPANTHNIYAKMVNYLAVIIESYIKNSKLINSPFIHVFNISSLKQDLDKNFFQKLTETWKGNYVITPLKKLAFLKETDDIKFHDFVNKLKISREKVIKENKSVDIQDFFIKILNAYVSQLESNNGCPRNIMPLYIYENKLLGYTDADYESLLDQIMELEIYKNFEKACIKLLS